MKKCLSLVLAGAMAGMLATGCGANGGKEGTAAGDGSETAGTAKETGISAPLNRKQEGRQPEGRKRSWCSGCRRLERKSPLIRKCGERS